MPRVGQAGAPVSLWPGQARPGQGQHYWGDLEENLSYRAHIKPMCGSLWPLGFLSLHSDPNLRRQTCQSPGKLGSIEPVSTLNVKKEEMEFFRGNMGRKSICP